jgi:hypothetical protein
METHRFARRVFWWSGLYGVMVLLPNYFLEIRYGLDHPPAITHPEFYYGFTGVGLAWQVAFFIIARDPARYRALMIPSIIEKVCFSAAAFVLWMHARIPDLIAGAAVMDLLLAGLFGIAYWKTPDA